MGWPINLAAGYRAMGGERIQQRNLPEFCKIQAARDSRIRLGVIPGPLQADQIIRTGQADLVMIAREFLRDPNWPLKGAGKLQQRIAWPKQYLRAAASGTTARDGIVDG